MHPVLFRLLLKRRINSQISQIRLSLSSDTPFVRGTIMVPRQGRSYMLSLFLVPSPSPIIPVSNASHFLVCILQSHYHSLVPDPLGLDHASCLDLPSASHTHPPCSQSIRSKLSFSHILSPVRGFLMSIPREGRLCPLVTLALQSPLHPPTASFHPMPGHATSSLGSQTLWLLCTQECPSFCVKTTLPCPQALSPQVSPFVWVPGERTLFIGAWQ